LKLFNGHNNNLVSNTQFKNKSGEIQYISIVKYLTQLNAVIQPLLKGLVTNIKKFKKNTNLCNLNNCYTDDHLISIKQSNSSSKTETKHSFLRKS